MGQVKKYIADFSHLAHAIAAQAHRDTKYLWQELNPKQQVRGIMIICKKC